ncbi:MAG: phage tail tape measure protein, partial [Pseudomonadota bacterium]
AKGAAFQAGQVVPFATGAVISQPTLFPMAGGRTGLMGERGPEAIMPLRRGRGGSLGVEASAAQPQVTVQNNVMLDPGELLERGLSTRRGERAVQRVVSRIQGGVARA